jgi:methionyl-tRNA synthetase
MLMAAELPLPKHVFVHGFLLGGDGRKMSKSMGNVLDPFEVIDRFGTDALRYYLSRDVAFGGDGSVSMDGVEMRYTNELANELGNLASRSLAMVARYRDGAVPDVPFALGDDFDDLADDVVTRMDDFDLSGALEAIWQRVRLLNRYVDDTKPWVLAKDPAQAQQLDAALATLVEGLRVITVLLHPWMPATTAKLLAALGVEDVTLADARPGARRVQTVAAIEPGFPKEPPAAAA